MRVLLAPVLLALVATAVHSCTEEEFANCATDLVDKYNLKIEDNAQVFPSLTSESELDQFCMDYERYQQCVRPLLERCGHDFTSQLIRGIVEGEDAAVEYACSPQGRRVYIEADLATCFSSPSLMEKTVACNAEALGVVMGEECRALNNVVSCVTKAVLIDPMCGEAEAKWTHEFNSKAVNELAELIDCDVAGYLEECDEYKSGEHGKGSHGRHGSHSGRHSGSDSDEDWWSWHSKSRSSSESHSGSHEHAHLKNKKMHRGVVIGLASGAGALILLLLFLAVFFCYHSGRASARRTTASRAQAYLQQSPTVLTGEKTAPAYVISSPTCEEKSAPPPEYRSQVSLQGWVGTDLATEEKQPLPEADYSSQA